MRRYRGPLMHMRVTDLRPFDVFPDGRIVSTVTHSGGVVDVHAGRMGCVDGVERIIEQDAFRFDSAMIVSVRQLVDGPTAEQWATAAADLVAQERRLR